jgi:tetratricopeptide (TPR) repeat protein
LVSASIRVIFSDVNYLAVGLLTALMATNQLVAATNSIRELRNTEIEIGDTNDPVEVDFRKVMDADDAAQAEVDKWIRENNEFAAKGAGVPPEELNRRILKRFEPVRKGYEDFLAKHPDHEPAHLAFAGFLSDLHDEDAALPHMEKARELNPSDPAVWNNLANYYGHYGEVKKAFEYYARAINLNSNEPIYYQNFGTTVYLFRKDAMEFYDIPEQKVFDKALELYAKAMKLDPTNFPLATDVAQTYYGIKPMRFEDALKSWTNALALAHDEIEREGVYVHFARMKWLAGRTNEARAHLNAVTNEMYAELKRRLTRNLYPEAAPGQTNSSAANKPDKN